MKRILLILICAGWLSICLAPSVAAQENEHGAQKKGEGDDLTVWKWANFSILAGVIGYFGGKALPAFFASRTTEIQKGIAEASALKADAERRVAEMELRLASLGAEIEQIRAEARVAMTAEGDRLRFDADRQMKRIQVQADQEIEAHTKRASLALKAHTAQLALDLAQQRIRSGMTGEVQGAMVNRFVQQLDKDRTGAGL